MCFKEGEEILWNFHSGSSPERPSSCERYRIHFPFDGPQQEHHIGHLFQERSFRTSSRTRFQIVLQHEIEGYPIQKTYRST